MRLVRRDIPVGNAQTKITIRHITDVHQGAEGFDDRLFKKFCKIQEADKNGYWIATGDIIDSDRGSTRLRRKIMYADRHDAFSQEDKRNMSWLDKEVIPRYEGIANRCLGILDGDHYLIFSNGMSSGQYICRQLGMPYLGERMAYVGLFFKALNRHSCQYNILARHGKGAASTAGGDVAALSRQSAQWISDLHLGGHTHRANIHCVPFLYPNQGFDGLRQRVVFYVRGGSFLQGYPDGKETYAENPCEYNPLCIGWAEIELTLNRLRENNNNLAVTSTSARLIAE